MLKYLGKCITITGLLLTCWMSIAQASETTTCGKDGKAACDVTFTQTPNFLSMCVGAEQTRVYTITNNTPVILDLTYIKVVNANGSPTTLASIVPAAVPSCGSALGAGASCNIGVEIDPVAAGTLNFLLEVGVNSSLVKISTPIQVSAVATCTADFETIPVFTDMCTINAGGNTPQIETFTIRNDSPVSVNIDSISLAKLDLIPGSLAVLGTTTCGASIAAGATCDINVNIPAQNTTGTLMWELDVVLDGIGRVATPINVVFSNTCDVAFSAPLPVAFNSDCGQDQKVTYIVKNNTSVIQTITAGTITLTDNGALTGAATIDLPDSTCNGAILAPGDTCTVVVDIFKACGGHIGTFAQNVILNVTAGPFGAVTPPPAITASIQTPASSGSPANSDYLTPNGRACAVLAASQVTNVLGLGTVVTNGDVCVATGTAITGFGIGNGVIVTPGMQQPNTAVAINAQAGLTTAYNTLAGLPCQNTLTGQDLGGLTLAPGVYCFSTSAQLTGILNLAATSTSDVFVFQMGSTLTTATNAAVLGNAFLNTANVYWVVGSSATLGVGTTFLGNILAKASITMNTGATLLTGRALASTGAVTLDQNKITAPNFP